VQPLMRFHDFIQDKDGWNTLEDWEAWANPYASAHLVKVQTPTREEGEVWTVLHRKGACVIVPMTADGNLLLVKQERIPIRATIWEFPAGQIDVTGCHDPQTIREAALRELREESGQMLAPEGDLIPLGHYFSSPGIMDEYCHLFLAKPVVPSPEGASYDDGEAILECRAFTPGEVRSMIACNEIRDANTLVAYARLCALGYCQPTGE
jgi:ADP-ribose pyrophosphatase